MGGEKRRGKGRGRERKGAGEETGGERVIPHTSTSFSPLRALVSSVAEKLLKCH